jgi:carbamoyltransferase
VWILGLSCYRDDATAALLHDGSLVGIAEEERFLRVKHSVEHPRGPFVTSLGEAEPLTELELRYFPERSVEYLLGEAGIEHHDVDVVAYDFDLDRRVRHWDAYRPYSDLLSPAEREQEIATWRYWQRLLREFAARCRARLVFVPHHLAHASGAVFGSGHAEAAYLVPDGLGELESTTLGRFDGELRTLCQVPLPHSLGILYAAVTSFLGFRPFSDEQKTMGLAAYGDPSVLRDAFRRILRPTPAGFEVDPAVVWTTDANMGVTRPSRLGDALGVRAREPSEDACQEPHVHVAAALQEALEGVLHHLANRLLADTGERTLCMAGGVALNCVANGALLSRPDVDQLFIQPQAGDSGTALGAAYHAHHTLTGGRPEPIPHAYWGPGFTSGEVREVLDRLKLPYRQVEEPWEAAAELLARDQLVGWFQGRAECGPRALGNRSILAHPAERANRERVNLAVKERENWRPFAASIAAEHRSRYLATDAESPFMLLTIPLTALGRHQLAAAAHVDGTTRPQTVTAGVNPSYHRLIRAFERRTGIAAVLNTSLNVRSEPIANEPIHAIADFYTTGLDALIIEDCVLTKHPTDVNDLSRGVRPESLGARG